LQGFFPNSDIAVGKKINKLSQDQGFLPSCCWHLVKITKTFPLTLERKEICKDSLQTSIAQLAKESTNYHKIRSSDPAAAGTL
jgi:hypothetical protein